MKTKTHIFALIFGLLIIASTSALSQSTELKDFELELDKNTLKLGPNSTGHLEVNFFRSKKYKKRSLTLETNTSRLPEGIDVTVVLDTENKDSFKLNVEVNGKVAPGKYYWIVYAKANNTKKGKSVVLEVTE